MKGFVIVGGADISNYGFIREQLCADDYVSMSADLKCGVDVGVPKTSLYIFYICTVIN